jgi:hypothetical protein
VPTADPGWWTVTGVPADSGGKLVEEILRVALAVVPEVEFHALPFRIVCTRYVDQGQRRVNQPARLWPLLGHHGEQRRRSWDGLGDPRGAAAR